MDKTKNDINKETGFIFRFQVVQTLNTKLAKSLVAEYKHRDDVEAN